MQQNQPNNVIEIERLKDQLQEYENKEAAGYRIRSRIKDYEKGEKSTKYFFGLEKKRGKGKMWTVIKDENGEKKYGIENILNEQRKFYKDLHTSKGINTEAAEKLLRNIDVKLSENDCSMCEDEI